MASACGMYRVEPVVDTAGNVSDLVSSSKCSMYRLPPLVPLSLHTSSEFDSSEVGELAKRHDALLDSLQNMKRTLDAFAKRTSASSASDYQPHSTVTGIPSFETVPHEVVVHCCPAAPPFCALPAVAALRGSGLRVAVCTATHSSLPKSTEIPAYLETLFNSSQSKARADHHIVLRLVWAEGAPQTRVSPLHQSPIVGHANLLRYLCRLLPANSELNYEAAPLRVVSATDAVLDLCEAALGGDAAAVLALMDGAVANRRGGGAGDVMLWAALRGMAQRGGVFRPLLDWKQEMDRAYLLSDGTGDAARAAELRQALQDLLKAEGRV